MAPVMTEEWYNLLRCVNYLGYHTKKTMSYSYDQAEDFTLLTINEPEVREIEGILRAARAGQRQDAAIWVVEGDASQKIGNQQVYRLREVFHPREIGPAYPEDSPGAQKDFMFRLSGEGVGTSFGDGIVLNGEAWFRVFLKKNGNFGFGLDHLRDPAMVEAFRALARPWFEKSA